MLALSYPWLGMPIEHLRNQNKPIGPFIMGHLMQVRPWLRRIYVFTLAWLDDMEAGCGSRVRQGFVEAVDR